MKPDSDAGLTDWNVWQDAEGGWLPEEKIDGVRKSSRFVGGKESTVQDEMSVSVFLTRFSTRSLATRYAPRC